MSKPTPTKLVLLMSAAGLSLSWSGVALASRDDSALSNLGAAPPQEQDCSASDAGRWMSCPAANGELLHTLLATSASLPLPLAAAPGEATLVLRIPQPDAAPGPRLPALPDGVPPAAEAAAPVESGVAVAGSAETPQPESALRVEVSEIEPTDAAALERVWVSLADVLGSQLDEAPEPARAASAPLREAVAAANEADLTPPEATVVRPALVTNDVVAPVVAASQPAAEPVEPVAASRLESTRAAAALPSQPAADIDDVVVAPSHHDKVLMSLAALRSADMADAGAARDAGKKVVLRHADKVLETLASLRSNTVQRDAVSCSRTAQRDAGLAVYAAPPQNLAADEALASLGLALDIDLDLLASPAESSGEPIGLTPVAQATRQAAPATASEGEHRALGAGVVALGSSQLDQVRGGFISPEGMKISFGIERAVYLNGTLVTTTSLNIADLSKIAGGQAQVSGNGLGSLGLLQSGPGNVFVPGTISSTSAGTIIQNTLNDQKIQTITRIDAAVNSTGILRAINLQSSMQGAIVNSLRR